MESVEEDVYVSFTRLPSSLALLMASCLKTFTQYYMSMLVGTACSGSDLAMKILVVLQRQFRMHFDVAFTFTHSLAVEINRKKREFLLHQFPDIRTVLGDVALLSSLRARCHKVNAEVIVPSCQMVIAGFSCTSRSRASNRSSQHANCVQNRTEAATSTTFWDIHQYISEVRPAVVIMENVKELLEQRGSGSDDMSDADFIVAEMKKLSYTGFHTVINSADHGAITSRIRLYFVFVQAQNINEATKSKVNGFGEEIIGCLITDAGSVESIISLDAPGDLDLVTSSDVIEQDSKRRKTDFKYKDDHYEIFQTILYNWPPILTNSDGIFGKSMRGRSKRATS
eukprot:4557782-Pyramimonas_sp.AAC.1